MSIIRGGSFVGWVNSGGGGGTGNIKMFGATCGDGDGPVNGASSWTTTELVGASKVFAILLAKATNVSIGPATDFEFFGGPGTIQLLNGVTFVTGDTIIGWYVAP